jgi:heme/copper-type cytochrome/quinol oxidase subunit 3
VSASSAETQIAPEPEDPELLAANVRVGVRLFVSAIIFVFIAFLFGFFYLKAVNSNGDWRPAAVKPSQGWGISILVGVILTALVFELARRDLETGVSGRWRGGAAVAMVVSVVVLVLYVLQLTSTDFGATGGGYASVFYGWNALSLAVWLGAVYWIETLLVGTMRSLPVEADVSAEPLELFRPSAGACAVYVETLGAIAIVTYVLLYLVK